MMGVGGATFSSSGSVTTVTGGGGKEGLDRLAAGESDAGAKRVLDRFVEKA